MQQAPKKAVVAEVDPDAPVVVEIKSWLPNPKEGEHVFGVAHIFASFNDTFVVRPRPGPASPCERFHSSASTPFSLNLSNPKCRDATRRRASCND
jgi:hypothetical protein